MSLSRRRFNQLFLGALGASMLSPALAAELIEGHHWRGVEPPQPSDTAGKIEVLEFFSYGCSHCKTLNLLLPEWKKNLPEDVAFRRIPVTFGRAAWANLARLFLALKTTDNLEQLDQAVFDALHDQRRKIYTEPGILEWIKEQGIDAESFSTAFNSFDVQTQLRRGDYLVDRYKINAVPTIAVAGRYVVLGEAAKGFPELLTITDALIVKARAEQATA